MRKAYEWLPFELVEAFVKDARAAGVGAEALQPGGFLANYKRFRSNKDLVPSQFWRRRNRVLDMLDDGDLTFFTEQGEPEPRLLEMVMWAHAPPETIDSLARLADKRTPRRNPKPSSLVFDAPADIADLDVWEKAREVTLERFGVPSQHPEIVRVIYQRLGGRFH